MDQRQNHPCLPLVDIPSNTSTLIFNIMGKESSNVDQGSQRLSAREGSKTMITLRENSEAFHWEPRTGTGTISACEVARGNHSLRIL